ncbi:hypothetical protein NDU88_005513 [Pleurodeles waltl]|uniref:Uncharacterized protein n=1 Tax=Pleurodeles waltl TaxID=8319 RepID=A0AAV7LSB4_PLEWA|nr:hypothetical protein NDU88_005513 [Pleurodeles waltl]
MLCGCLVTRVNGRERGSNGNVKQQLREQMCVHPGEETAPFSHVSHFKLSLQQCPLAIHQPGINLSKLCSLI